MNGRTKSVVHVVKHAYENIQNIMWYWSCLILIGWKAPYMDSQVLSIWKLLLFNFHLFSFCWASLRQSTIDLRRLHLA